MSIMRTIAGLLHHITTLYARTDYLLVAEQAVNACISELAALLPFCAAFGHAHSLAVTTGVVVGFKAFLAWIPVCKTAKCESHTVG